jgi:ubiquinone/menaquinone biosynthesis C-methylase UbiE
MIVRFIKNFFENKQLEMRRRRLLEGKNNVNFHDNNVEKIKHIGFYETQKTSPMWQHLFKFIGSFCTSRKTVVAVGCGGYELMAVKNSEETTGIDLSKEALLVLKKSGFKGQLINADSLHLPFKEKSFEVAYSNQVIEHMLNINQIKQFIKEIERLSSNVMIITPNSAYNRKVHDPTHFFFFTTRNFKPFLPDFKIFSTNYPYDKTLAYYFLFESPRIRNIPYFGKFIIEGLRRIDTSKTLTFLNRKLWPGNQIVAIKGAVALAACS